jgi:hypothetical protein
MPIGWEIRVLLQPIVVTMLQNQLVLLQPIVVTMLQNQLVLLLIIAFKGRINQAICGR